MWSFSVFDLGGSKHVGAQHGAGWFSAVSPWCWWKSCLFSRISEEAEEIPVAEEHPVPQALFWFLQIPSFPTVMYKDTQLHPTALPPTQTMSHSLNPSTHLYFHLTCTVLFFELWTKLKKCSERGLLSQADVNLACGPQSPPVTEEFTAGRAQGGKLWKELVQLAIFWENEETLPVHLHNKVHWIANDKHVVVI